MADVSSPELRNRTADVLRNAFDAPGGAGFERGGTSSDTPPRAEPIDEPNGQAAPSARPSPLRCRADRRAALQAIAGPAAFTATP
jgi:hypothetical protein